MAKTPLFDKILIANRGEIACRVIATCRRLGIATIAVYSDADHAARHVRLADEAVHIGASPAADSYLRGDVILAAARASGAQAIHPGYGFLSENADFASACAEAGIVFIGPSPHAIRAMGDKSAAKALMQHAGVPLTPGYHGDNQDPGFLRAQADAIGYPVLIKASAGGGGKGMRRVDAGDGFAAALASCQREAGNAFGNAHVLVEKYVERPRHIEIQVFGDHHGNLVHLFERDCSVQRRHQKVLEEAPAPGMTPARRAAMGAAAIEAARAVGYVGAGTVEFIAAPDGTFYFMEMNTRLQVEHPVTELITGTDLVAWQLQVAAGDPLPLRQEQLAIRGHAIEARLYAEDTERGFLPSTGTLRHLRLPHPDAQVRVDSGVEQGDAITPFYDPMIAKLIAWGEDRDTALRRLRAAVAQVEAIGVTTNAAFLWQLAGTASFTEPRLDTALIEREQQALSMPAVGMDAMWPIAAVAFAERNSSEISVIDRNTHWSPWNASDDWRIGERATRMLTLRHADRHHTFALQRDGDGWSVRNGDGDSAQRVTLHRASAGAVAGADADISAASDGHRRALRTLWDHDALVLKDGARQLRFELHHAETEAPIDHADSGTVTAPMPGRIIALLVEPGTHVTRGQPLLVMEAMKMEHTIDTLTSGILEPYRVDIDEIVTAGQILAVISGE